MRIVTSALLYFALVFGTGVLLGSIRLPFLVPRLGERLAELIEAPFMLLAILLAARWVSRRRAHARGELLALGLVALALVLTAELVAGWAVRGLSPARVLLDRDPIAGAVYYLLLGLFAVMPRLAGRAA